jgi:hypothetical protein
VLPRILAMGLLAGLGVPAFCQNAPVQPLPQVPYSVIYDSFFFRVMWLESRADKLAAEKADDSGARWQTRTRAGLTEAEDAAVKRIARSWSAKLDTILAVVRPLAAAGLGRDQSPLLRDLATQRERMVLDHVAQLQSALGPASFKLLDMYVRRTSTVRPPLLSSQPAK